MRKPTALMRTSSATSVQYIADIQNAVSSWRLRFQTHAGLGSELCAFRRAQLDPTHDGKISLPDVQYLLLAVAGKYRLLSSIVSDCRVTYATDVLGSGSNATFSVEVTLVDEDGLGAVPTTTSVLAELALNHRGSDSHEPSLPVSDRLVWEAARFDAGMRIGNVLSGSNALTQAEYLGADGRFALSVTIPYQFGEEVDVEVALMIETADASGQSESVRKVPLLGSSVPPYSDAGYSFQPILALAGCAAAYNPPFQPPPVRIQW